MKTQKRRVTSGICLRGCHGERTWRTLVGRRLHFPIHHCNNDHDNDDSGDDNKDDMNPDITIVKR